MSVMHCNKMHMTHAQRSSRTSLRDAVRTCSYGCDTLLGGKARPCPRAQVRYELLGELLHGADIRAELAASILVNWVVGPALMTGLAWATLPDLPSYRNGAMGPPACQGLIASMTGTAPG